MILDIEDHVVRMLEEAEDLSIKIEKADKYLQVHFDKDLEKQVSIMLDYQKCIDTRIRKALLMRLKAL